jgi:hypothetical protein
MDAVEGALDDCPVRMRRRRAAPPGVEGAIGTAGSVAQRRAPERLLAAAAFAWLASVALIDLLGAPLEPVDVGASPDELVAGEAWRLLGSALIVDSGLAPLQIALLTVTTAVVLARHGAVVWWLAALTGHLGSTLIAYALIGAGRAPAA